MDFVPRDRQIPLRGTPEVGLVDVGFGKLYILDWAGVCFEKAYFGLGRVVGLKTAYFGLGRD